MLERKEFRQYLAYGNHDTPRQSLSTGRNDPL
jgi:hypothetical protein